METLYRHWADAQGTADECTLSADPTAQYQQCTKDGVVTYEPLLAQDFQGDILPALNALEPKLERIDNPALHGDERATDACTAEQTYRRDQRPRERDAGARRSEPGARDRARRPHGTSPASGTTARRTRR